MINQVQTNSDNRIIRFRHWTIGFRHNLI